MAKKSKAMLLLVFLMSAVFVQAQNNTGDLPGYLYTNEKMGMVAVVLAVVVLGILLYLFLLDRKLGRIEKELRNKNGK